MQQWGVHYYTGLHYYQARSQDFVQEGGPLSQGGAQNPQDGGTYYWFFNFCIGSHRPMQYVTELFQGGHNLLQGGTPPPLSGYGPELNSLSSVYGAICSMWLNSSKKGTTFYKGGTAPVCLPGYGPEFNSLSLVYGAICSMWLNSSKGGAQPSTRGARPPVILWV